MGESHVSLPLLYSVVTCACSLCKQRENRKHRELAWAGGLRDAPEICGKNIVI